jgi:hypothetical protein
MLPGALKWGLVLGTGRSSVIRQWIFFSPLIDIYPWTSPRAMAQILFFNNRGDKVMIA